ncbi:MAG: dihydrodipicolinate synthase family protein [Methylobacteriaceae bacterium]|nr:dihydrodipicolinate synthase family protein [Methylobacteriaceae bacterium]
MPVASKLRGVIAAIATPITAQRAPDLGRFLDLGGRLLAGGCDGLNVLGTTGEATSLSRQQRAEVMRAAARNLDLARLMVGTGAAALEDAVALTRLAAELGFAGALVVPPFYYKGVSEDGVFAAIAAIAEATAERPIPIYLYHFPALSGVPYAPALVARLISAFPDRIAGLKDSSGDVAYSSTVAQAHPALAVFPSSEATLLEARSGPFAGCISATANLNADLCARAYRNGEAAALERAVAIRALFDGRPVIAGVKAGLAHLHHDNALALPMPPLVAWGAAERTRLGADLDRIRSGA